MPEIRVPVLPLLSSLHRKADGLLSAVRRSFYDEARVTLVPLDARTIAAEPAHALLVLSGGTEGEALAFARDACGPVILLSHPAHNSLPAALEIAARLRRDGRKVQLVHLGVAGQLSVLASAIQLARGLRGKRAGLIGDPSPWLVASSPSLSVFWEKLRL